MESTLQVLNALEREGLIRRYAIGGAMGATFYVEPVLTFDLDVFVLLPQQTPDGLVTLTPSMRPYGTGGMWRPAIACSLRASPSSS